MAREGRKSTNLTVHHIKPRSRLTREERTLLNGQNKVKWFNPFHIAWHIIFFNLTLPECHAYIGEIFGGSSTTSLYDSLGEKRQTGIRYVFDGMTIEQCHRFMEEVSRPREEFSEEALLMLRKEIIV